MTQMLVRGVLVIVNQIMESTDIHIEPVNLSQEENALKEPYENTLDSALRYVKQVEAREIAFDLEYSLGEDEASEITKSQQELETISWGDLTDKGYYAISSVWAGPANEGGAEYRFYPVTI